MRPNRSDEMPPTNPAGAPSRAIPTATLRQDPPTFGLTASPPSAPATGTKSIKASPQLSSMVCDLSSSRAVHRETTHRLAALAIKPAKEPVDLQLAAMEFAHSGRGRRGQRAKRRHRRHGFGQRWKGARGNGAKHGRAKQHRLFGVR